MNTTLLMLKKLLQTIRHPLATFWPMQVIGDDHVGWSARYPWDKSWCWASKRETVITGCRQRAMGR